MAHNTDQLAVELAAAQACDDALVRKAVVIALAGIGDTHLRALVKAGAFPAPLKLAPRCVRWRWGDVKSWLRAQAAKQEAAA